MNPDLLHYFEYLTLITLMFSEFNRECADKIKGIIIGTLVILERIALTNIACLVLTSIYAITIDAATLIPDP